MLKLGRNDACSCGSGKKFKTCCASNLASARAPLPAAEQRLPAAEQRRLATLVSAGRHTDSEILARELLIGFPDCGLVHQVLGLALWVQGKDAIPSLQRAVELMPDDAEAHGNLGNAQRAAGQLENAARSHRRAVALKPTYAEAHNNLGSVLLDLGWLDHAAEHFLQAVTLKPGFALAHSNLANVRSQQNRNEDSETSCRRALELNPNLTAAIVQLAELQAGRGDFTAAEGLLKRALEIDPNCVEALAGVVRLRKMTAADTAWLGEAQRLVGRGLAPGREVHLRYALGKYFDDVGEYTPAFENYRRANELGKIGRPAHHRRGASEAIDRIIEQYDGRWLSRARLAASSSERPVLIVGMPRSGTTLAEQILAAHGEVFGAGELPFWNTAASSYAASRAAGQEESSLLGGLAQEYLSVLHGLSPQARRVVDKMPGNFLYLGLIHAALPNARIIHLRRNPLDTCLSIYFQNFGALHSYANDLEDLAHYYTDYGRLMDHWRRSLPPEAMLEVRYEELVEDPEAWSRRMVEFIGLEWDPACLEFHRSGRTVNTFSKWQARQKISTSSVDRWRHYQPFLPLGRLTDFANSG
jgi:Flp pilus assembly protein TadD